LAKFNIYSIPNCLFCEKAKVCFDSLGIQYHEINLESDAEMKAWFKLQGFATVPQIYAGAEYIGGYSELVAYLHNWEDLDVEPT
jgi:glutaredoxin